MQTQGKDPKIIQEFGRRRSLQKTASWITMFLLTGMLLSIHFIESPFIMIVLMMSIIFILFGHIQWTQSNYTCPSCGGMQLVQARYVIKNLKYCKSCGIQLTD